MVYCNYSEPRQFSKIAGIQLARMNVIFENFFGEKPT